MGRTLVTASGALLRARELAPGLVALRALENVFTALDGKGSITKTHNGEIIDAINRSTDGTGETDYFRFRACRNRNLHLEFKRLDLLARLNQIAGGARLRPKPEAA